MLCGWRSEPEEQAQREEWEARQQRREEQPEAAQLCSKEHVGPQEIKCWNSSEYGEQCES